MIDSNNRYTRMQRAYYDKAAAKWSEENPDPVVGSFHKQNACKEYENLFTRIENQQDKIVLDFACGPGRSIVRYNGRFKRIDGVDICSKNIENARGYTNSKGITDSRLFVNNGVDLEGIESDYYDVVMSTIALQHICVYDIRFSLMTEFFRVLKSGGIFTAQMGIGLLPPSKRGYYDNYYDAKTTNSGIDVCIVCPCQIKYDLVKIGFRDFDFTITDVGAGVGNWRWIFFSAIK